MVVREAQQHSNWIDSLMRGVGGDGVRGMDFTQDDCAIALSREVAAHVMGGIMTVLYRICAAHSGVRLLPRGEIELPPQPPRIQRYVVHG